MPIYQGATEIVNLGKIKKGSANVTKVYRGATLIWPLTQGGGDPVSFAKYSGRIAENIVAGFLWDNMPAGTDLGSPIYPGDPFVVCGSFESEIPGSLVRMKDGSFTLEDAGAKSIHVAFSKNNNRNLGFFNALNGTIEVRRLTDNVLLASATVSIPAFQDNGNPTYILSWTNAVNDTRIGITINVNQICIV